MIGPNEEVFSVEINYGGLFCGFGSNKSYIDGKIEYFDGCEVETWSPLWIKDFLVQLGYDMAQCNVYWLLPGMDLDTGLRIVDRDTDTLSMSAVVPKFQHFQLYVDHKELTGNIGFDDVCITGSTELPPVLSPTKHGVNLHIRNSPRLKTKAVKGMLNEAHVASSSVTRAETDVQKERTNKRRERVEVHEQETDDSSSGSEWVDSDNEVQKDDDDLFAEWVDDKHEKKKKRKSEWIDDSDYDSEELVELKDSDVEDVKSEEEVEVKDKHGQKKKKKKVKLKRFRPENMKELDFHIGMVFLSVIELRGAIQEYIVQNRVHIKYLKNDKQRVRAHCVEGCPWYLFAAPDSRTKSFVVKKYIGEHTCSKEWELQQFTARYLAKRYLEKFRADEKMSLQDFARIVQLDFNMTPTRSKLSRARRIALKQIKGDELKQYDMLWDYAEEIRTTNPGSSMFLTVKDGKFESLYMSLDAAKRGFLASCRPVICIDGCHLKTRYGGIMLTAVGIDPNDCIFPIAIGVVEVEDKNTWK